MDAYFIAEDLRRVMKETRDDPGLPLEDVALIIRDVLEPEEVQQLIKELSKVEEVPF